MNELRWILLGFGIALLAGIYLWGRRFRPGVRGDGPAPVIEPPRIEPDYRELDIPPHLRSGEPSVQPPVEDPYAHVTEPLDEPEEPAISAHDRSAAERVPSELKRDSSAGVADEDPEPVAESGSGRNDEQTGGKFTTFRSVRKEPRLGPLAVELDAGATSMRTKRPEPTLGSTETAISESRADAVSEVSASDPDDTATPESDQTTTTGSQPRRRIFAVRLVAPAGSRYHGRHLLEAFRAEQLQHGRYGIFHRLDGAGDSV
ncbi:MAG TPA: hypothetical protein VLT59_03330, partial [Steroidobacteraceae bacterium]|nr:hypothetical protein [Steroidobacteraceae bacterium]